MGGRGGGGDCTEDLVNGPIKQLCGLAVDDQPAKVIAENIELPEVLLLLLGDKTLLGQPVQDVVRHKRMATGIAVGRKV